MAPFKMVVGSRHGALNHYLPGCSGIQFSLSFLNKNGVLRLLTRTVFIK